MAEHRMRHDRDGPLPSATRISLILDEQNGEWARDRIPESRTFGQSAKQSLRSSKARGTAGKRTQQFVMSYSEANALSPVQMKKGDFIPHIFNPALSLLPMPGTQLSASQYLFLEREQDAEEHVLLSAELSPLQKADKKGSFPDSKNVANKKQKADPKSPSWRSVEHFRNWQDQVLKSTINEAKNDPNAIGGEREVEQDPVLYAQGVQQSIPVKPLNLEALDQLVSEITDHTAIQKARQNVVHTNATMTQAAMGVLRNIATDRIDRFGCQEPDLVKMPFNKDNEYVKQFSEASVILDNLRKPKPPIPKAHIKKTYPKLKALLARRAEEKKRLTEKLAKKMEEEAIKTAEKALEDERHADEQVPATQDVTVVVSASNIGELLEAQRQRRNKIKIASNAPMRTPRPMLTEN